MASNNRTFDFDRKKFTIGLSQFEAEFNGGDKCAVKQFPNTGRLCLSFGGGSVAMICDDTDPAKAVVTCAPTLASLAEHAADSTKPVQYVYLVHNGGELQEATWEGYNS